MSTAVDCKRSLEIEVPTQEVERAKERVVEQFQKKARLPGFRPGKAPVSLVRSKFDQEIRAEVLETLIPQAFRERVKQDDLKVVGSPDITDLHFEPGEPLRFKADFEVAPEIELGEYRGIAVQYEEPSVSEDEIAQRLESLRESKADFVNQDPRPIENSDFVLLHLKSISGLAEPIDQEGLQIEVGSEDTMTIFNENLVGMSPEETKEVEVTYPEDYAKESLAGKTVRFQITPKVIQKKELPALDDEFARDLGDYKTLDELKDGVKASIFQRKQFEAQQKAKEELLDKLVEAHLFPVPEAYIDRQIENQMRARLREIAAQGVDPRKLNLDWNKIRDAQKDKAAKSVKASLILEKIAEKEGIHATRDEVDRELHLIARQEKEPVAAVRARFEKEGYMSRIADHIQTEKTLQFLFDQAQKTASVSA